MMGSLKKSSEEKEKLMQQIKNGELPTIDKSSSQDSLSQTSESPESVEERSAVCEDETRSPGGDRTYFSTYHDVVTFVVFLHHNTFPVMYFVIFNSCQPILLLNFTVFNQNCSF